MRVFVYFASRTPRRARVDLSTMEKPFVHSVETAPP
jgi:hypothetical protein